MDNNNSNVLNNNWVSFHKMNNEHHPSGRIQKEIFLFFLLYLALLEPINYELNDIPLNLETVHEEKLNTKGNIVTENVICSVKESPPIEYINELNCTPPTNSVNKQNQTSAINSNQTEVILVVSDNLNQQQQSCNKQKQYSTFLILYN